MKFATKTTQHYPLHLRNVATLPWEIQKSNFVQISSRYGKMQFKGQFKGGNFFETQCIY